MLYHPFESMLIPPKDEFQTEEAHERYWKARGEMCREPSKAASEASNVLTPVRWVGGRSGFSENWLFGVLGREVWESLATGGLVSSESIARIRGGTLGRADR